MVGQKGTDGFPVYRGGEGLQMAPVGAVIRTNPAFGKRVQTVRGAMERIVTVTCFTLCNPQYHVSDCVISPLLSLALRGSRSAFFLSGMRAANAQ